MVAPLQIGKLRHRLALQSPTPTQAEAGEVVNAYGTDSTVWGSLRPLTGREQESAHQISEEINYRAIIRYHATIATEWRISHDSETYEIVSILNYNEVDAYLILELKKLT